jgi:glycosyltransferase involved in cell wall biosynthesis
MPESQHISAVIITLNEEQYIEQCIRSVQKVADEVILVDSYSTDKTVSIARQLGAKVLQIQWKGYAETKNWGNTQAAYNTILSIDADEILSEELINSIVEAKKSGLKSNTVYSFNRLNNYCGKWMQYAGWYPDIKVRIFNRNEVQWQGEVHETLVFSQTQQNQWLKGDLLHYSIKDKADHIAREKKYASLARPYPNQLLAFFTAIAKFVKMYIFKQGFRAGKLGFQLAYISAQAKFWRKRK